MAQNPWTALSQLAEVGVKWNVHRGWRPSHSITLGVLVGGVVVEDGVDGLPAGTSRAPSDRRRLNNGREFHSCS
jgi:hypothetical protein